MHNSIQKYKSLLKKNALIYKANATIKEFLLHREYNQLFSNIPQCHVTPELIQSLIQEKVLLRNLKGRKPNVIWVGACYQQDYSGFMQALKKIVNVIEFTRLDGTYGVEPPAIRKGLIYEAERVRNGNRLKDIFAENGGGDKVDLVIGQMWSTLMDPSALKQIKDAGTVVINIAMDDKLPVHWKKDNKERLAGAIGLGSSVDLTLNTFKQASSLYNNEGYPCIYWPLASNGSVFSPRKEKKYDVVFVGSNYGYRGKVIQQLRNAGINVSAFGPGFPSGMLSAEQSSEVFGSAKIVLGMGFISFSRKLSTLKLRDFDALFTGALYITSRNDDLEELFVENETIAYYDSVDDLIEKIKMFLDNDFERQRIADNALSLANEKHTWEIRIKDTLRFIGFDV